MHSYGQLTFCLFAGGGNLRGVCVSYNEIFCTLHQDHTCRTSYGGYSQHGQCGEWTLEQTLLLPLCEEPPIRCVLRPGSYLSCIIWVVSWWATPGPGLVLAIKTHDLNMESFYSLCWTGCFLSFVHASKTFLHYLLQTSTLVLLVFKYIYLNLSGQHGITS